MSFRPHRLRRATVTQLQRPYGLAQGYGTTNQRSQLALRQTQPSIPEPSISNSASCFSPSCITHLLMGAEFQTQRSDQRRVAGQEYPPIFLSFWISSLPARPLRTGRAALPLTESTTSLLPRINRAPAAREWPEAPFLLRVAREFERLSKERKRAAPDHDRS